MTKGFALGGMVALLAVQIFFLVMQRRELAEMRECNREMGLWIDDDVSATDESTVTEPKELLPVKWLPAILAMQWGGFPDSNDGGMWSFGVTGVSTGAVFAIPGRGNVMQMDEWVYTTAPDGTTFSMYVGAQTKEELMGRPKDLQGAFTP